MHVIPPRPQAGSESANLLTARRIRRRPAGRPAAAAATGAGALATLAALLLASPQARAGEAGDRLRDACLHVSMHDHQGPEPSGTASWLDDPRRVTAVYVDLATGRKETTQCIFADAAAERPMLEAVVVEPPGGAEDRELAGIMNGWLETHYDEVAAKTAAEVPEAAAPEPESEPGAAETAQAEPAAAASEDGEVSREADLDFWCAAAFRVLAGTGDAGLVADWKAKEGADYDAMAFVSETEGRSRLETEGFESEDIAGFLAEYATTAPPQLSGREPATYTRAECDEIVGFMAP